MYVWYNHTYTQMPPNAAHAAPSFFSLPPSLFLSYKPSSLSLSPPAYLSSSTFLSASILLSFSLSISLSPPASLRWLSAGGRSHLQPSDWAPGVRCCWSQTPPNTHTHSEDTQAGNTHTPTERKRVKHILSETELQVGDPRSLRTLKRVNERKRWECWMK